MNPVYFVAWCMFRLLYKYGAVGRQCEDPTGPELMTMLASRLAYVLVQVSGISVNQFSA